MKKEIEVLVGGYAGAGKTTVAEIIQEALQEKGFQTVFAPVPEPNQEERVKSVAEKSLVRIHETNFKRYLPQENANSVTSGQILNLMKRSLDEINNLQTKLASKEEGWEGSRRRLVLKKELTEIINFFGV